MSIQVGTGSLPLLSLKNADLKPGHFLTHLLHPLHWDFHVSLSLRFYFAQLLHQLILKTRALFSHELSLSLIRFAVLPTSSVSDHLLS